MTQSLSDQQYADRQEQETAGERARGHVDEIQRLIEQGASLRTIQPFLDQLRADLNTVRPRHAGWGAGQYETNLAQGPQTPSGLAVDRPDPNAPIVLPASHETDSEGRAVVRDENGNRVNDPDAADAQTDATTG